MATIRNPYPYMLDQWQPRLFYHVIGKAVPGRVLYRDWADEKYFLRHTLRFGLHHFLDILVYCLCVNHFHLVVQTRSVEAIRAILLTVPPAKLSVSDRRLLAGEIDYPSYAHYKFAGALAGYAVHYNHRHRCVGQQLLVSPTLHGLTDKGAPGELFSRKLGAYVGLNFVKHRIAPFGALYRGSSLTYPRYGLIDTPRLLDLYGGAEAYRSYHATYLQRHGAYFYGVDEAAYYAALRPRTFDATALEWYEGDWRQGLMLL